MRTLSSMLKALEYGKVRIVRVGVGQVVRVVNIQQSLRVSVCVHTVVKEARKETLRRRRKGMPL